MTNLNWVGAVALALSSGAVGVTAAQSATLEITVENVAAPGGFAITPLYMAFHDGNFDAFDVGAPATPGVETLAELGDPGGLPPERNAVSPDSQAIVAAQPANGPPTIDPGESSTVQIDVDGETNRFFTFLSMLVPSNDTFLGNDDPEAFELFDDLGGFLGPQVIDVTGAFLYDAGTEVNDPDNGAAFVAGNFATEGTAEGGTVQPATSQSAFAGVLTPLGSLDGGLIDFAANPGEFGVARITIAEAEVAPVPLPAAGAVLLGALAALGALRARRRPAARLTE